MELTISMNYNPSILLLLFLFFILPTNSEMGNKKNSEAAEGVVAEYNIPIYCNACERAIAKTISRYKGVESFITDKNHNKVAVWGQFDPTELLKKLRKKTGKRVEIVERKEVASNDDVGAPPGPLQIPEDDPYVTVFSDENTNSCIIL